MARGFRAAFAGMKADAKARTEANLFERHYNTKFCCDCCGCTQPFVSVQRNPEYWKLRYTDFSPQAPWRATVQSHEQYMLSDAITSPYSIVPGWRKERVLHDLMHTGPLGFMRDVGACLAIDFVRRGELGPGDKNMLLRTLWKSFRRWCKSAPRAK